MRVSIGDTDAESEIWSDDLLGRHDDADFLITFLTRRIEERVREGRSKSYVLNLNSGWGQGKTFFLKRLKKELDKRGHLSAYINAWEDDHADTPLIAVMSAIEEAMQPHFASRRNLKSLWNGVKKNGATIAVAALKGSAKNLTAKVIGSEGADEVFNQLGGDARAVVQEGMEKGIEALADQIGENLLSEFKKRSESIKSFKNNLTQLLEKLSEKEIKSPFFVLVDELDRCRPTYAISMLEQIKHLFDADGIVFVIATDSVQLSHSVCALYGQEFDSVAYLRRFFDRHWVFPEPSIEAYVKSLFQRYSIIEERLDAPCGDSAPIYFCKHAMGFGLTLRDIEQCFDLLRNAVTIWEDEDVPLYMIYLLPLIICHQQSMNKEFEELVSRQVMEGVKGKLAWRYSDFNRNSNRAKQGKEDFRNFEILADLFRYLNDPTGRMYEELYNRTAANHACDIIQTEHIPARLSLLRYPALVSSVDRLKL